MQFKPCLVLTWVVTWAELCSTVNKTPITTKYRSPVQGLLVIIMKRNLDNPNHICIGEHRITLIVFCILYPEELKSTGSFSMFGLDKVSILQNTYKQCIWLCQVNLFIFKLKSHG